MAFTVQVNRASRPAKAVKVRFSFDSILRGMSSTEYTDSNGVATFNEKYERGQIKLFIEGTMVGKYVYEWGNSITVTI